MKISIGNSRMEKHWVLHDMPVEELRDRLSHTIRTAESVEQYKKLPKIEQDNIKDVGGFVLGTLKDGVRKKTHVLSRSGLTLDMDYAVLGIIEQIEMLFSFHCFIYSTHKHTPEMPRLRLVIPLARDVSPDEYSAISRKIAADIGIDLFDDTTYEPSRLMYWPSTSEDGEFIFREIDGDPVDPDKVLARYDDWRDSSAWPVSSRQQRLVSRETKSQTDPLTKPGIVGAFCRAYTVQEAIENFLSDVYARSAMPGRYDYIPASSQAGVVIYDDKFCYSHHATDPACGRLLNAFDIVRVHLFGDKDDRAGPDTPAGRLPSYIAMKKFASSDERVRAQLAAERNTRSARDHDVGDGEWQTGLELDQNGRVKDTLQNIALIVRKDPNLRPIVYNEFKSCVDVVGQLPWVQVHPGWSDADVANAKLYFERVYGLWSPAKFKDGLLAVVSAERIYHPIKEYFRDLDWDGNERLDTLLIDYLGADDTPYVRAVTRKTFTAAVARVYEPGIKFDSILILSGRQGIGKSTLFQRMGCKWYSDSLTLADMRDKTAAEKLQGYWILELGELAGIRKVDVETVKSFVTRTDDKYRQSYGTVVESHPRTCVIVGSTNAEGGFLRDISGNRRFWPVPVTGNGIYKPWDLNDPDQFWAEAIHRYRDGEKLFLSGQIAADAYEMQQDAMESDDREGIVQEYLNTLLPDDWDKMDIYERKCYLAGSGLEHAGRTGTMQRTKVCIMEIWCECFERERQNLRRSDAYEIETILIRLGWSKYTGNSTGKIRIPIYGVQRAFVRGSDRSGSMLPIAADEADGNK